MESLHRPSQNVYRLYPVSNDCVRAIRSIRRHHFRETDLRQLVDFHTSHLHSFHNWFVDHRKNRHLIGFQRRRTQKLLYLKPSHAGTAHQDR